METLTQTFVVEEWEDAGLTGFCPKPCSDAFNAGTYALGLAHDFIEHAGDFSVEGEIKAHAAMYWLRYEGGYLAPEQQNSLDMESFTNEWSNLYQGILTEGGLMSCPEQSEPLDDEVEEDLKEIISQGKRFLLREVEKEYIETDVYAMLSRHFADWFRLGYHEAERRYEAIGRLGALDAFIEVMGYFEKRCKHASLEEEQGQSVEISLNLETGCVTIEEQTECYDCGAMCNQDFDGHCEDCHEANEENC